MILRVGTRLGLGVRLLNKLKSGCLLHLKSPFGECDVPPDLRGKLLRQASLVGPEQRPWPAFTISFNGQFRLFLCSRRWKGLLSPFINQNDDRKQERWTSWWFPRRYVLLPELTISSTAGASIFQGFILYTWFFFSIVCPWLVESRY